MRPITAIRNNTAPAPISNEGELSEIIDFSSGLPDPVVFPYQEFQHCINKAIDTYKHQLFTYGDSYGLVKLRRTLASHLAGDQIFAPQEERRAISRLASKYNVYVVGDDYMADLGIERSFEPIYSYNQTSPVIYLKSFSKIIFPGLRLGAMVLPEALVDTYRMIRRYAGTSLLSQAALEIYMNNGMFEWHKNRIASRYAERIRILNAALQQHIAQGWVETPDILSGIYAQFKIPLTVNLERLIEKLAEKNIRVRSGKQFYLSNYLDREKFLRISVSRARSEQINEGIKEIIEEVR
ncbi:aminotransferase class I/II-fold pyridoxal phosphate-dependent enzyme [Paenibacillus sp. 32O-W]|uniref:aminotransferase class I/II-fold pyridoxal phosphate-dependent enzyme n=1 Tax=Paenibacillus sp. 32O-W TaxID=1695218 RepID=UPI00119E9454|nr:aminotransferase class I/II-fold pyridoxal phosphate-dependent enzyme [Paenibacillus sp. 32O-W]